MGKQINVELSNGNHGQVYQERDQERVSGCYTYSPRDENGESMGVCFEDMDSAKDYLENNK